jgi:hypothetical protein
MLRARWDAGIERVIVERVDGDGRRVGYDKLTLDEFDAFCDQAEEVRYEAFAAVRAEGWPDERVELPAARVEDDNEADLPTVVRLSDGSARVDLEFGDDARLDRRLGELGRE